MYQTQKKNKKILEIIALITSKVQLINRRIFFLQLEILF